MKKYSCDIVVIVHRFWIDGKRKLGGLDKLVDYCLEFDRRILMIEHPLEGLKEGGKIGSNNTVVTILDKGNRREIFCESLRGNNKIFSWINEFIFNIKFLSKNLSGKPTLFSSDPLNNLTGIFMKKKFNKIYFHNIDYSCNRFNNVILDFAYSTIYKISLLMFDKIGVVSQRTRQVLINNKCNPDKIVYIPNSPFYKKYPMDKKEPFSIISTSGGISEKYRYEYVLQIVKELKKNFRNIRVYLLGGLNIDKEYSDKIKRLIKEYKLENNIDLTGFLNNEEMEKYLIVSKIGLSFYSDSASYYTVFGDSLKIREYALFGIPTISDGRTATDDELVKENAGFVVNSISEAVGKIALLLRDKDLYNLYQRSCLDWARKSDKKKILNGFLKSFQITNG